MEALIKKAAAGDLDAYWKVIVSYQDYLYRIAFLYSKNEDDALDAVYDAILKGYHSIKTLKNSEQFKSWITRITINCVLDEMRKHKKVIPVDPYDETEVFAGMNEHRMSAEYLDLYRGIDDLKEEEKTAVILKYFAGFDISEIAQIMNYSPGGIKALLHRARKKLNRILVPDSGQQ